MKLVDILARELAEWPEGISALSQQKSGYLFDEANYTTDLIIDTADDWNNSIVTRCQWQQARDALLKADSKEWNGEGLPPVGTVCEMTTNDGYNWRQVQIIFFDDYIVLVGQADVKVDRQLFKRCDADVYFRPIRTPEQIAAEERESAINGMLTHDALGGSRRGLAEALYDAGYRKQEPK